MLVARERFYMRGALFKFWLTLRLYDHAGKPVPKSWIIMTCINSVIAWPSSTPI
jgi:hypothetical protein